MHNFHQSITEALFLTFFNPPTPHPAMSLESPTRALHRTATVFSSQTRTMLITSASLSQCHGQAASECNRLQDQHHQSTESGGDRNCHHPREDNVPEERAKPTIRKATSEYTHIHNETRFNVFTAQHLRIQVFWDVGLCHWVSTSESLVHVQGQAVQQKRMAWH